MRNVTANARYWIAGTVGALAGVFLARGVAPALSQEARLICTVSGQLLALGGLLIICYGVSRRVRGGGNSV